MDSAVEVQIHGGYGFVKEYHVERFSRRQDYPDLRGYFGNSENCDFCGISSQVRGNCLKIQIH
jgi:hypothetical protein